MDEYLEKNSSLEGFPYCCSCFNKTFSFQVCCKIEDKYWGKVLISVYMRQLCQNLVMCVIFRRLRNGKFGDFHFPHHHWNWVLRHFLRPRPKYLSEALEEWINWLALIAFLLRNLSSIWFMFTASQISINTLLIHWNMRFDKIY